jgi:hypothetical protein
MGKMRSLHERIAEKIRVNPETGCHEWGGSTTWGGYGMIGDSGRVVLAHRAAWQLVNGKIQHGLTLDHLCRNRSCVNPDHLEAVTQQTNVLRGDGIAAKNAQKTHCKHGHEFTAENTYLFRGRRTCKECNRGYTRDYQRRKRATRKRAG